MASAPIGDHLSELQAKWEQSFARHPVSRAAWAEAKTYFPKPGEPRRTIPWPVLNGPISREDKSTPLPTWTLSQLNLDTLQVVPAKEPRRLQGGGGFPLIPDPPPNSTADPYSVTVCFLDVYQAIQSIAFLGYGMFFTIQSFDLGDPVREAADLLNTFAAIMWIASFVSSLASTCRIGRGPDSVANCVSGTAWIVGNLEQIAADALYILQDCDPAVLARERNSSVSQAVSRNAASVAAENGAKRRRLRLQARPDLVHGHNGTDPAEPHRKRHLRHSLLPPWMRVEPTLTEERKVSLMGCSFDAQAAASFFARFGLSVVDSISQCTDLSREPQQAECAWNALYTIENLGWAIDYLELLAVDCPLDSSAQALCSSSITDIIVTGSSMVPAVAWAKEDCDDADKPFAFAPLQ